MEPLTLGLVLAVLGTGGTLIALFIFSLIADLLKRLFPVETLRPVEGEAGGLPGSERHAPEVG